MKLASPISSTLWTRAGRVISKGVATILKPESASEFKVAYHTVIIPHLPEAFEAFRIVQLSDIHFYEFSCDQYHQRITDAVNNLKPDMIVTTGDIIHYGTDYLAMSESYLSQLQAPWGKWSCMGNHDYSDDAQGHAVREMMRNAGFQMLMNEAIVLEKDGQKLWLSGVDDLKKGCPDPDRAVETVETDLAHICLIHNPRLAPIMDQTESPPDLILAGHTHGGQIHLPMANWIHREVFRQPYVYGWFNFTRSNLYVTSGVGSAVVSWHLPPHFDFSLYPFRVNTLPEVAVFELTAQPQTAFDPHSIPVGVPHGREGTLEP
jgi:uncharacterized protein